MLLCKKDYGICRLCEVQKQVEELGEILQSAKEKPKIATMWACAIWTHGLSAAFVNCFLDYV